MLWKRAWLNQEYVHGAIFSVNKETNELPYDIYIKCAIIYLHTAIPE